jgi:hypothetical protein
MKQSWSKSIPWMTVIALCGLVLAAGCDELPANFWANKSGEILNRSIFAVINAVLAALTGGTIVL